MGRRHTNLSGSNYMYYSIIGSNMKVDKPLIITLAFISLVSIGVACTTPVLTEVDTPGKILEYPYPEVDTSDWEAPRDFCVRHYKAAKTRTAYSVDICEKECERDPRLEWCEDAN